MNVNRSTRRSLVKRPQVAGTLFLFLCLAGYFANPYLEAATNVVLWDTGSPFANTISVAGKTSWKLVPSDLLALEADPPKASSDPGYYGRAYSFRGDAVVENQRLAAVFWAAQGRVVIYAKDSLTAANNASPGTRWGEPVATFVPPAGSQPVRINRYEIIRNADDEVVLQAFFATQGSVDSAVTFAFGKHAIVEITPAQNMKGLRLLTAMEYGIAPGFIGDDLIFSAADYIAKTNLFVPAQNMLLGLVKGEQGELVLTWPNGKQQLQLGIGEEQNGQRMIESIDINPDGQSLYLAVLAAPGIWHREPLTSAFLEKDKKIQWKPPFPAKWTTQLHEGDVKTTFAFRDSKGQIWRGVPGQYRYPVWFEGETACYHLSKKVPPKGESLVYFLEGKDTPLAVMTPVEILKATLGRAMADPILDVAGKQLRTHHRRGGEGVRRACTCGCTEAIQAVFEAGKEVEQKTAIAGAVDDMLYFVQRHVERIDEYQRFAADLLQFLRAQGSTNPELKPYLDNLIPIAEQLPQEYNVQKDNMKSLEYAAGLARQTLTLASKKDPNNVKAYMELLKAWRDMGGAQDYIVAISHTITRKLCQEAGYQSVSQAKAAALAEEIQTRCRHCLRHPDGYEIWADY